MDRITSRRWARVVFEVKLAERASTRLPSRAGLQPWQVAARAAWRADLGAHAHGGVLAKEALDPRPWRLPLAADVVRVGRFDIDRQVRLRAFYSDGVTLRLQGHRGRDGVGNSITAHRHVARWAPGLMPALFDHGRARTRGVSWLVENRVGGRQPWHDREILPLLRPIVEQLHRVHVGVGVESRRLSTLVNPQLRTRWAQVVADLDVPADLGRVVADLLARDGLLEVSFGHGDLVSSNIRIVGDDVLLLDWEHAGTTPIAFDLAKLHLQAGDPVTAVGELAAGLAGTVGGGSDHYSLVEQLALAHVQMLSWHPARRQRAEAAGRLDAYLRQTRERIDALGRLLA